MLFSQVKERTGRNLKGLGFILRRLEQDREFTACGRRWFFDHRIAGTYMRLVGGTHNEPETQSFLSYILEGLDHSITFIDVGANIGEMVVPMAAHPKVTRVIGFEPHPVCAEVCRKNLALNRLNKTDLHVSLVGDGSAQPYVIDPMYAPTSAIRHDLPDAPLTRSVRLDDQADITGDSILLIDVEGAELDVMKGGQRFIRENRPLVIFEYNFVNRTLYTLNQVREVLGQGYEIVRLRSDGYLDRELGETWNCVAIPTDSVFAPLMQKRFAAVSGR
jgi:FkbM family methyltransferase